MSKFIKCDICGKTIDGCENYLEVEISKEYTWYLDGTDISDKTYDFCKECFEKLDKGARALKKESEEE